MIGAGMLTRPIPSTGEALPVIGLGTWRAFDVGADQTARQPLREVLRLLLAAGGRIIDGSPMYGRAEAVTGDLLAELDARPRAFLATKVWTTGRDRGIEQMRRSDELLHTEIIDLMQIHNLVDSRTHLATLRRLKDEGRVRYIDITHYTTGASPELARILASEPGIDFVQLGYSPGDPGRRERAAARCRSARGGGHRQPTIGTRRSVPPGPRSAVPDWAREFDCTSWAQLFLKYILAEPAVTCVIPATSNPQYMRDDLGAGFGRLPDARQRQQIRRLWEAA